MSVKPPTLARFACALGSLVLTAGSPPDPQRARTAFLEVARVLQSPRCLNCHPDGDAPLQFDVGRVHRMKIRRDLERVGLRCETCHQESNLPGAHMPPGAPGWNMPPSSAPMVFQHKSAAELCRSLKDPSKNGHRSLAGILNHVRDDAIVRWGFAPGDGRTLPPLTHEAFVARVAEWIDNGAECPEGG